LFLSSGSMSSEFEEIYKEQFPLVYNYLFYHIRNTFEAEDLTADVFVRVYEYWDSFSHEKGNRGAWVGGIARNRLKTYFQKKSKKLQTVELTEFINADSDVEGEYLRKEDLSKIFSQLDALDERQREIVTMKYILQFTNREIAKQMNMTESNVGVTLHRSIKRIQSNLKAM